MVPIEMSMDARLMLTRMSLIYEREQGRRVKMSRDEDIVAMINFALETLNSEYQRYYQAFVGLLSAGEIRHLVAQGAQIYRGAAVPEEPQVEPPSQPVQPLRSYRGVVSGQPVPEDSSSETPAQVKAAAEPEPPGKPKKVYRGRIIEE